MHPPQLWMHRLNRLQKFDWYDLPIPLVSECHEAWLFRIPLEALEPRCCARVSLCGRHMQDCGGSGIAPATICAALTKLWRPA
jgi:hypothetical protein